MDATSGWRRLLPLLLICAALAWPQARAARGPAWTPAACALLGIRLQPGQQADCGYVTVPLRHDAPAGPQLRLATVVLAPVAGPRPHPEPLFMAQGGPGLSTIGSYARYLLATPSARPALDRDIVLWDQRGTQYSKPRLDCPEVQALERQQAYRGAHGETALDEQLRAYARCGQRLAGGAGELSAFNSAENARDVEAIRRALGYARIDFYGVSYGTEVGQLLMRLAPRSLHAVVLDAVVPLTYDTFTEPAFAKRRIASKYFSACAVDPRCNAAYPDLSRRFVALLERLDAAPVQVNVADPTGVARRVRLSGEMLEQAVYGGLYLDIHRLIPMIVDRADRGDYTFVSSTLLPMTLFDQGLALGMHMAVACADHGDTDPATVDYSALPPRLAAREARAAAMQLQVCRDWQIALLPRALMAPVRSEVPVLLLSGEYDPITPPAYAAQVAARLPRAQHVVFQQGTHGQAINSACANRLIGEFLLAPTQPLQARCAAEADLRFLTDADVMQVPLLHASIAEGGAGGLALAAARSRPVAVLAVLLLSAWVLYPAGWLLRRLRRRRTAVVHPGASAGTARRAPALALLTGLVASALCALLVFAVRATLATDDGSLLMLGALPGGWLRLRWLGWLLLACTLAMLVVCVQLWVRRQRTLAGRLYYTLLALAALGASIGAAWLGLLQK